MKNETVFTLEGSTFWKFLTQEMTRSVTSDLSRKQPLTSSEKRRINKLEARVKGVLRGRASTRTLKYFIRGKVLLLAAILTLNHTTKPHSLLYSFLFDSVRWMIMRHPNTTLFSSNFWASHVRPNSVLLSASGLLHYLIHPPVTK